MNRYTPLRCTIAASGHGVFGCRILWHYGVFVCSTSGFPAWRSGSVQVAENESSCVQTRSQIGILAEGGSIDPRDLLYVLLSSG